MIGIYKITNIINGKVYIGQSGDINRRWINHSHNEQNKHLKSAFEKYGKTNFDFEVIKELHNTPLTQILLDDYEKKYITEFNSMNPENGYNKREGGTGGKPSEETKAKISNSMIGKIRSSKTREKMSASKKGIKHSVESRANNSDSHKGQTAWNKGKKASTEARAKNRVSHLGKTSPFKGKNQSIYSIYKQRFTKIGWKAEFDLEIPQVKTFIGEY